LGRIQGFAALRLRQTLVRISASEAFFPTKTNQFVIARFMRATQFPGKKNGLPGRAGQ
jgi:hypothetical protein